MPGAESNLPGRKVRKQWKREGQAPRGRLGEEYLLPKYESSFDGESGKTLPAGYEASRGQYARLATPSPSHSPPRAGSFENQPQAETATFPRGAGGFDSYAYSNQG